MLLSSYLIMAVMARLMLNLSGQAPPFFMPEAMHVRGHLHRRKMFLCLGLIIIGASAVASEAVSIHARERYPGVMDVFWSDYDLCDQRGAQSTIAAVDAYTGEPLDSITASVCQSAGFDAFGSYGPGCYVAAYILDGRWLASSQWVCWE